MTQENNRHYYKSYTPNRTDSILGKRLKALMNRDGINQNQLAHELKVNKSTVSSWLKANSIQSVHLIAIAKYFDVTTDYLLGLSNSQLKTSDVKTISDSTGLSDIAVLQIMSLNQNAIQSLNALLSNTDFLYLWDIFLRTKDETVSNQFIDAPLFSSSEVFLLSIQKTLLKIHAQYQKDHQVLSVQEIKNEIEK